MTGRPRWNTPNNVVSSSHCSLTPVSAGELQVMAVSFMRHVPSLPRFHTWLALDRLMCEPIKRDINAAFHWSCVASSKRCTLHSLQQTGSAATCSALLSLLFSALRRRAADEGERSELYRKRRDESILWSRYRQNTVSDDTTNDSHWFRVRLLRCDGRTGVEKKKKKKKKALCNKTNPSFLFSPSEDERKAIWRRHQWFSVDMTDSWLIKLSPGCNFFKHSSAWVPSCWKKTVIYHVVCCEACYALPLI